MVATLKDYLQVIKIRSERIKSRYPGLAIKIDELIKNDRLANAPRVIGFETTFAHTVNGVDVRIVCTQDGKKCDIVVQEGHEIDPKIWEMAWEILVDVYGLCPEDLNQNKFLMYERRVNQADWAKLIERERPKN